MAIPEENLSARLREAIRALAGAGVLVVGDIMLDKYLFGDAERISPEAPIPVVRVEEEKRLLGGAGNVARNIRFLGGRPMLVSLVGMDGSGAEIARMAREEDIDHEFFYAAGRSTTTKTRVLARRQQMLRIDREESHPLSGAELGAFLELIESKIADYGVLIVSDYGKGLITRALLDRLEEMKKRLRPDLRILVDPKSPNFDSYDAMFLMTPNLKETEEAAGMRIGNWADIVRAGRIILGRYGCPYLLSTLGARGMALFEGPDTVWHLPTAARSVYDVTGAGDTVIATLALSLAAGIGLRESCLLANCAAGLVVGKVGAAAVTPEELAASLDASAPSIKKCASLPDD